LEKYSLCHLLTSRVSAVISNFKAARGLPAKISLDAYSARVLSIGCTDIIAGIAFSGPATISLEDPVRGHGLSYTTFDYSPLKLERDHVDVSGELRVSLIVTNTGKRRGTEVMQLYAADTATDMTLPAQQLIGFARLDLELGESRTVTFAVPMSLLGYTGISGDFIMGPGPVEVGAGSSSSDIRSSAKFTVTGKTRVIKGEERAFLSVATVE